MKAFYKSATLFIAHEANWQLLHWSSVLLCQLGSTLFCFTTSVCKILTCFSMGLRLCPPTVYVGCVEKLPWFFMALVVLFDVLYPVSFFSLGGIKRLFSLFLALWKEICNGGWMVTAVTHVGHSKLLLSCRLAFFPISNLSSEWQIKCYRNLSSRVIFHSLFLTRSHLRPSPSKDYASRHVTYFEHLLFFG